MPAGSDKRQMPRSSRCKRDSGSVRARRRRGFTLLEWLISIAIIGTLASISTLLFRKAAEGSVMAQARNAVITYAQVARSYALANHIETMLVVNPFNGRFEVWYSNPPPQGGAWNLQPTATEGDPGNVDSYAFAPILDPSARLPRLPRDDEPAATVHPIDYMNRQAAAGNADRNMDNLTWAAFCFDETGQLVIRTRRIATRTFYYRNGTERSASERNRLRDETPDLTQSPLVKGAGASSSVIDTPITSTSGFVISDSMKLRQAINPSTITPADLVTQWLDQTREGMPYRPFAEIIVLNRFTGQQLLKGAR
jgi:prepilin-type N-terminal cleavage/methylation domain-containing protein